MASISTRAKKAGALSQLRLLTPSAEKGHAAVVSGQATPHTAQHLPLPPLRAPRTTASAALATRARNAPTKAAWGPSPPRRAERSADCEYVQCGAVARPTHPQDLGPEACGQEVQEGLVTEVPQVGPGARKKQIAADGRMFLAEIVLPNFTICSNHPVPVVVCSIMQGSVPSDVLYVQVGTT
eukprot:CAMPEP_0194593472 /NCGR_PEP_ID=MMETSP0292-20121207/23528_1 /TAXON_ID=39354 /ORGANISM="Heterosigma akashiwo, Strain CCMP2393" /LENGTH=181 /DNA_ID=CAMNT_0039452437 /DNA_START=104 /DNA_END=650 /DNA_ORIENTATION=-